MSDVDGYLTMLGEIYIVYGEVGSYSDHRTWNVIAYGTEKEANDHVRALTKRMKELAAEHEDFWEIDTTEMKDLDPRVLRLDEDTTYGVEKLPFGAFSEPR